MRKVRLPGPRPAASSHYAPDRRSTEEVLALPPSSASAWGSTTWKRMRLCPREHALYQLGLRPQRRKEALDTGLLFHYALEAYFRSIQEQQKALTAAGEVSSSDDNYHYPLRVAAEQAAWAVIEPFVREPGYEETANKLEKLLVTYLESYRRTDRWVVLAVEETLTYSGEDFEYTARLDLIVYDVDLGMLFIVEHKTAGTITDDLLQSYEMDLQILGQVWLLHRCVDLSKLPPYGGVIVDIITTRNNPPRVHRQRVLPSKYHVASFAEEQRKWAAVKDAFEALGWPKAFGSCAGAARFFKSCTYYDLCHGHPGHSVEDWEEEFKARGAPFGFDLVKKGGEG